MLTSIFLKGRLLTVLIGMSYIVSVSNAPPYSKQSELERVVVDDDRFWETGNQSPDIRDAKGGRPQALPDTGYEKNQDNKHWYDATKTLFKKWGYEDKDIPEPIGAGHSSTSVRLTPEFTTILRGLVEKVPEDLERDILNILKGNGPPNSNAQINVQSEGALPLESNQRQDQNHGLPIFPESNNIQSKGSSLGHDLELLDKEIKQLETLRNENPILFDDQQGMALSGEIAQIHNLIENKNVDISSSQLKALDNEIAKIQDLTTRNDIAQPQKQETLDELIRTLEEISHPRHLVPLSLSNRDHDLELLDKEIRHLEMITNESPDLFDQQHRKSLDEEIGQMHALIENRKVDVSPKQVQSLDVEIAKLESMASKNSVPESEKQETLDDVIRTLQEISYPVPSPSASSYFGHEMEELDQEVQKLEALVANEDHHGLINENQKQTLKDEIQALHNVKDITAVQLKDLDQEIRQIEELVHPTNSQPNENQMEALDEEIKELQHVSHTIQGSETPRYKKICEEKGVCTEPEKMRVHAQQTVEHTKYIDSKHGSTDHVNQKTLSESHSGLPDETIIAEDTKAIDHLIEEIVIILEKAEEKHLVEDDEVHNGQTYLHELTDLVHEVETFAMACASETQTKHHKSTAKSDIASRNEDMIIKEIQKKEGPIDETSPIESSWSKLLESNDGNQDAVHLQKDTPRPQSFTVEEHLKDINEVIGDIARIAKLERQHPPVENTLVSKDRPAQSQPNLQDVDSQKVETLEKVIHNLHELVIDEESLGNFDRAENKQRLNELIHQLEGKKSSGDPSAAKLESILNDLEKDSDIEFELQRKLHKIDEAGPDKGRNLDDVISGLEKLSHFPVKPNNKITEGFENDVKKFEASHPSTGTSKNQHHWTSFNDEVQQLKEASRHHDPAPQYQTHLQPVAEHHGSEELDDEIRRIDKLISGRHNQLQSAQIKALDEEVRLLEEMNRLDDHSWNSNQREQLDKKIKKIELIAENKDKVPPSRQKLAMEHEIDNLDKVIHSMMGPVNNKKSSHDEMKTLNEEAHRLAQLVHNHLFLTHLQKKNLQEEIEELENIPPARVDSNMKMALNKEIGLIEDMINKPMAPSPSKLNDEINRLHKLTHESGLSSTGHNSPNNDLRPHPSTSQATSKNYGSSAGNNFGSAEKIFQSHRPHKTQNTHRDNHNQGIDDVIKSLDTIQNEVVGLETKKKVDDVINTLERKPHNIAQNRKAHAYFLGGSPVNIDATGQNVDKIWDDKSKTSNSDHLKRQGNLKKSVVKSKLH